MQNIIAIHNFLRWIVIIIGLFALFRAYRGWLGNKPWRNLDKKASLFFTISMDIQILIGAIIYIYYSTLTKAAFHNFGEAMKVQILRFFALEHLIIMLIAVVLLHIGNAVVKKDLEDKEKFKKMAIYFSIATLLILFGIPWFRSLLPQFNF